MASKQARAPFGGVQLWHAAKHAHTPPSSLHALALCVWCGCAQVVGRTPFQGSTPASTVKRIGYGCVLLPKRLSAAAGDFMRAALTWQKETRPCLGDLMAHDWVQMHLNPKP